MNSYNYEDLKDQGKVHVRTSLPVTIVLCRVFAEQSVIPGWYMLVLLVRNVHEIKANRPQGEIFLKVASYLADFDTRWPHEYEIFNFARFSSRIW